MTASTFNRAANDQTAADTTTLSVDLDDRSYPIDVGPGLLANAGARIKPVLKQQRVFIVTDSNVAPLLAVEAMTMALRAG